MMAQAERVPDLSNDDEDAATTEAASDRGLRQRRLLFKRLMDVVALPSSVGNLQDRAIAGDLLLEMLLEAEPWARELCSRRLKDMSQAPKRVLRFLALDEPDVSLRIINENKGLDEADLIHIVTHGGAVQRVAVADRRDIGPALATALADFGDAKAMATLLHNPTAVLSDRSVDALVNASRQATQLTTLLIAREELRPAHALAMFWWCNSEDRQKILQRFSADRMLLIDGCADVFRQVAEDGWVDPLVKKAMQVIERRQRNRAALDRSDFESLEKLIETAARDGMTRQLSEEMSILSGIKSETGDRIYHDQGGQGLAVLCKATGLKRPYLKLLWTALGREESQSEEEYARVELAYDSLPVAKAQTVLRYWNWCMESAFTPDVDGVSGSRRDLEFDMAVAEMG